MIQIQDKRNPSSNRPKSFFVFFSGRQYNNHNKQLTVFSDFMNGTVVDTNMSETKTETKKFFRHQGRDRS